MEKPFQAGFPEGQFTVTCGYPTDREAASRPAARLAADNTALHPPMSRGKQPAPLLPFRAPGDGKAPAFAAPLSLFGLIQKIFPGRPVAYIAFA